MPILVYLYCILLTASAIYGVYLLKANNQYKAAAGLFVIFCWLICIDFYVDDLWVFKSQIALAIYLILAVLWQFIELLAVKSYMRSQNKDSVEAVEEMQQEFGQSKNFMQVITGVLAGFVIVFYSPIIYMAYSIFINIPNHPL